MESNVKEIHDTNYEQETNTGVTVVDFRADWCPPCKMMDPILKSLSANDQLGDKVKFTSINVDNDPQIAGQLGIQGIPTFLIKKDGKIVNTLVGARPKDAFRAEVEKFLD